MASKLIFKNGPYPGMAIELRPGLNKIGRNPNNDFQIIDPSISGFHCELQVSDLGIAFRDLGSTNGSYINGKRVSKDLLTAGIELRLGSIDFKVDVPFANIAIPDRPKIQETFANFMEDGSAACQKHAEIRATQKCAKCEKSWCDQCVRRTGLVGSKNATISCLECGGPCVAIVYVEAKKKNILGRIGDTMKLFKK